MFNYKKTLLIVSLVLVFLFSFCIVCFCASPLTDSLDFNWNSYVDTTYNITSKSYNSSDKSTTFNFSSNGGSLFFVLVDFKSLGFLSGESYNLKVPITISSSCVSKKCKINFGLIDKLFSSGSLPDNLDWFYESPVLTSTSLNIPTGLTFSVPANWQTAYILIQFVPTVNESFSGSFTLGYSHISRVNKIDTGEWNGDEITFPNLDDELSDLDGDFQTNTSQVFDFLNDGWEQMQIGVQGVSIFFGEIFDLFGEYVPEYYWLILFSLMGGAFCLVLFKRH